MKIFYTKGFVKIIFLFLISSNVFSDGDLSDAVMQKTLDTVLMDEYKPCSSKSDFGSVEINSISSFMILSGDATFSEGDEIVSSSNARAIILSFDKDINKLRYYQNAETGFKSFLLDDKVFGGSHKGISFIKEFVFDSISPCSELIIALEESPQQMFFIFTESDAAIQAKISAQEMMAEIEREMALAAFQQKLEDERAAAVAATAAYRDSLIEAELAAFEAQLEAELAAQEMMAEIQIEMAKSTSLSYLPTKTS